MRKPIKKNRRRSWPWIGALIGLLLLVVGTSFFASGPNAYEAGRVVGETFGLVSIIAGAVIGYVARRVVPARETTEDIDADFR